MLQISKNNNLHSFLSVAFNIWSLILHIRFNANENSCVPTDETFFHFRFFQIDSKENLPSRSSDDEL